MNIFESENKIVLENPEHFNLSDIFDCGQCFRFNKISRAGEEDDFEGVAFGKYLRAFQKDGKIYFETNLEDFNNIWRDFFDLDRDYEKIFDTLRQRDEILKKASDFCPGVRILKQDPFECLISFIFSQQNNIPRIKRIIERLCENFGDPVLDLDKDRIYYSFPSPEKIANLTLDDLDVLKSGFRAEYILGASKQIVSGEINLKSVYNMTTKDGAEYLKQIRGVGNKIAACVMLFAYNKLDSFPVDVWIKRVLEKYYPADFSPQDGFGEYAGVANEYLYYYERKQ